MATSVVRGSDDVRIRAAERGDAAELGRLRWDFREHEHERQPRDDFLGSFDTWWAGAVESGNWVAAVAESTQGPLVGSIFMECVHKVPTPGGIHRAWGYVTNSYVESGSRGRGVGRRLISHLVDAGRARDLEFLIVWPSTEAMSFYARAGFRSVSAVHAGDDDEPPLELVL